jgi:hypothetical protein
MQVKDRAACLAERPIEPQGRDDERKREDGVALPARQQSESSEHLHGCAAD